MMRMKIEIRNQAASCNLRATNPQPLRKIKRRKRKIRTVSQRRNQGRNQIKMSRWKAKMMIEQQSHVEIPLSSAYLAHANISHLCPFALINKQFDTPK